MGLLSGMKSVEIRFYKTLAFRSNFLSGTIKRKTGTIVDPGPVSGEEGGLSVSLEQVTVGKNAINRKLRVGCFEF